MCIVLFRGIAHYINLNFGRDFLQISMEFLAKDCYVPKPYTTFILHAFQVTKEEWEHSWIEVIKSIKNLQLARSPPNVTQIAKAGMSRHSVCFFFKQF